MSQTATIKIEPTSDDPEDYAKLAREAQARLDEARARSQRAQREAALALKRRSDLLEAETPGWEALHTDGYSSTEILITQDGYFVRAVFQKPIRYGEPPVTSSMLLYIQGPPPKVVPDHGAIVVTQRDLRQGITDVNKARLSDLVPSLRVRTATEILLRTEGGVKVLKAPDMVEEPEPEDSDE